MGPLSASNVRAVILHDLTVDEHEFEARTGWAIKPQGACKAEACVPLPTESRLDNGRIEASVLSERLGMPLVADEAHGIWALGPETAVTGKALTSAVAPERLGEFVGRADVVGGEQHALGSLRSLGALEPARRVLAVASDLVVGRGVGGNDHQTL